jgi:hypothetical protein
LQLFLLFVPDDSIAEFQAALLSPDIQKKIENFKNKDINNSQILIDDASAELSNIFISAASISLKRGTKSKKSYSNTILGYRHEETEADQSESSCTPCI